MLTFTAYVIVGIVVVVIGLGVLLGLLAGLVGLAGVLIVPISFIASAFGAIAGLVKKKD